VRCLRAALPADVPVGTVDKFQGQEAPVVFFSMASSSGDDVPRGLDFLFSRNRLNVAVSRARCLAILVVSPRLLEIRCRSVEQLRLVSALCRLVELAPSA
jgi:superfamily I DNA and/or RNA helicase